MRVLLIPDRYAHYRKGVFEALLESFDVTLLASYERDVSKVEVAHEGGFVKGRNWHTTRDYFLKGVCFWQTGVVPRVFCDPYDALIIWGDAWRISTWVAVFLARSRNRKVVMWTHGLYGTEGFLRKSLRVLFYRLSDHVFTYGRFSRDLLIAEGFASDEITVVSNSIPDTCSSVGNTDEHLLSLVDEEAIRICFIGRLQRGKTLDILIQLVAALRGSWRGEVVLHVVGDGPAREELVALSRLLNVGENVIFHGAQYDLSGIYDLVKGCICCVSPGNVGLTAMTSLRLGIPVITHSDPYHQMPEYEAVLSGVTGQLFTRGDVGDLMDKVFSLVGDVRAGRISATKCKAMIESRYSVSAQIKKIKHAIDRL